MINTIYIAASNYDARFTRICVASIRQWHPEIRIALLCGGAVDIDLIAELTQYWNVESSLIPQGNYGWGFVKLEPLFAPFGERFLTLDSDTVVTGPILDRLNNCKSQFVVDDEDESPSRAREIYWDSEEAYKCGIGLPISPFYFNTGQWVGSSGVISRAEFDSFLEWSLPRRLKFSSIFKNGEQGILAYVVNKLYAADRLSLERIPLMIWPGRPLQGEQNSILAGLVENREGRIVHWAGLKNPELERLPGWALLDHFEELYYSKIPRGPQLRKVRASNTLWKDRGRRLERQIGRLKWLRNWNSIR